MSIFLLLSLICLILFLLLIIFRRRRFQRKVRSPRISLDDEDSNSSIFLSPLVESSVSFQRSKESVYGDSYFDFWKDTHPNRVIERVTTSDSDGSSLRVVVVKSKSNHKKAKRPIVFIPGWGVVPEGFKEMYASLEDKADLYYIETREKKSSTLKDPRKSMSVAHSAQDLACALNQLGLVGKHCIVAASCWAATIVLYGLAHDVNCSLANALKNATLLLFDPMHTLWFPKWLLRYVTPLVPSVCAAFLKKPLSAFFLSGMASDTPHQRRRAQLFIDEMEPVKWKYSAMAAAPVSLLTDPDLSSIDRSELFVINGTRDKIHDPIYYPMIAEKLPSSKFLYMRADNRHRERLMGIVSLQFALVTGGIPDSLSIFEKSPSVYS